MRLRLWIAVLGLVALPAMAGTGGAGTDSTGAGGSSTTASSATATAAPAQPAAAPAASSKADPAAAPASPSMENELQQLRDLIETQSKQLQEQDEKIREQQEKMQALDEKLNSSNRAIENLAAAPTSAPAVSDAQSDQALAKRVDNLEGKFGKLSDLANGKVKIGATFFGDFSHYTDTSFGPQWYDNVNQLGPGDPGLNVFEATRAYLNFFYTPNDHVTLRVTPDIYRQIDNTDGGIASNAAGTSTVSGSENGNLTFRLKYAYVDLQKYFGDGSFKNDKITFGQTQNPLIDWEEGLSGYRYAYLMPWNYLSLSSTYVGARLHGPIEFNGKEFLDYDMGVFTTASFHSIEVNDKKQAMARLSWYPFGTKADRTGLGFTVFEDYGYNTKFPSQKSTPLNRLALFAHYQTHNKAYQVAFEYDLGHNALSTSNLFSGTGPSATPGPFATFSSDAGTILSGTHTRQQGFAIFGHARLGDSPFSLFGLFQYFEPNTHFVPSSLGFTSNPIDFERTAGGISYKVTDHFDFAFGDENFHWIHPQGLVNGGDTNAIALWTQYNY